MNSAGISGSGVRKSYFLSVSAADVGKCRNPQQ